MLKHARMAALALAALSLDVNAQFDANFQNLLTGLTQGTEVTLLTPLSDGTVEVTSFFPPGRMNATDAAAAIEQARIALANFGIEQPTGAQFAAALVGGTQPTADQVRAMLQGGTVMTPSGTSITLPGLLSTTPAAQR